MPSDFTVCVELSAIPVEHDCRSLR